MYSCLILLSKTFLGKAKTWESERQKLLGVETDETLSFDEYILPYVGKLERTYVLARLSNFMYTNEITVFMKAFIESEFGYCPVI